MPDSPRIAVISPFLDRRHGTERCIIEQVERLAHDYGFEIHLYCQRVENVKGVEPCGLSTPTPASGRIFWHKVSDIPGPHLLKFLWWMVANRFCRWRDTRSGARRFDAVYSPGINDWAADAITVHIVFHEFYRLVRDELRLRQIPLRAWPRALHRNLYYHLIIALERHVYKNRHIRLAAVSGLTARQLETHFGRKDVQVIPNAVDVKAFSPITRQQRRAVTREQFGLAIDDLVLLFVGNDWKKKGLRCLLDAMAVCSELPLKLIIVGRDDQTIYRSCIAELGLEGRVTFVDHSSDIVQFYAAADTYVSPSLEDAFGLPVLEAMACGLPVIVSIRAGVSDLVHDGVDGLILQNPKNHAELARLLRNLYEDPGLRQRIGEEAARAAHRFSWEENVAKTKKFLETAFNAKRK
ncbi:MAG TPA: glycosyltransferase family 4 protein [Candidatus Dormibacteraeota bacterium]|nr:glycosyltransferase family 4 protein [Candidatus Dormibacteraeota bacterium]